MGVKKFTEKVKRRLTVTEGKSKNLNWPNTKCGKT